MNNLQLIEKALDLLELTPTERIFYLTVVKTKKPHLADVVRLSGLRRPTAYQALKHLKSLGLLITDNKKYGQSVSAVSASRLLQAISAKQRKIRKLELNIKDKLSELQSIYKSSLATPLVRQFEGSALLDELHKEVLQSKSKLIRFMGSIEDYMGATDSKYRDEYIRDRLASKVKLKVICNPSELINKQMQNDHLELRERKIIPTHTLNISSSFAVYDDVVIFFSLNHEQLALSITSTTLAQLHKNIFDDLWKRY